MISAGRAIRVLVPGLSSLTFKGVNLLDWDLLTLAGGGTSLQANLATGAYIGETVSNIPAVGGYGIPLSSGGGFSRVFPRPTYQADVAGYQK